MVNSSPKNISDKLNQIFIKVGAHIENMDQRCFKITDTRRATFASLQNIITPTILQINLFVSLNQGILSREDLEKIWKIIYIEGYNPDQLFKKIVDDIDTFLRASFLTQVLFCIENLFNYLYKTVCVKEKWRYSEITKSLLNELFLDTVKVNNFHKILITPAKIRNSLHNNGLYTKETFTITIKNIKYDFTKNEIISCASWEHVLNSIDAVLEVIEEIFESPKIKKVHYIEDISIKRTRELKGLAL